MDERLRLTAEMRDNASPVVKKIKAELSSIRRTPGMEAATKWMGEFNEKADGFVKSGGGAAGVINAMGIGGLTAAASLATLVSHFKELGERTLAMKELGREVGLTTDQVNQLNHAAARFGVAPDKMQGAINHFASQMPQFTRGFGQLHDELAGRWPSLTKKLQLEDTEHQLQDIFEFLGKIKNPQDQKNFAELIFGNGDDIEKLFAQGPDGFMKALDDYKKSLPSLTEDLQKQAQALRDSIISFGDAIDRLETKAGPTIIKGLNDVVGEFNTLFDNLDRLEKWWDKVEGNPGQGTADAVGNILKEKADANAKARAEGKGSLFDLPGAILEFKKGYDDAEARKKANAPYGTLEPFHKSSFTSGDDIGALLHKASFGGFGTGSDSPIAAGTKAGVLAAFRELMQQQELGANDDAKPSVEKASYGGAGGRRGGSRDRPGPHNGFGLGKVGSGGADDVGGPMATGAHDPLKDLISKMETGTTGPRGYDTVYGHAERGGRLAPPKPVSQMTIGEVLDYQRQMKPLGGAAAFPVGRGQWVHNTLQALTRGMDKNTIFSPEFQEKLLDRSIAGRIHQGANGFRQEWDSFRHVPDNTINAAIAGHLHGAITPHRSTLRPLDLPDVERRSRESNPADPAHTLRADIHLHDPRGNIKRTSLATSAGADVKLHRWPTMTTASDA